jgi:aspartate/methionine/tyrosine aminotransferase
MIGAADLELLGAYCHDRGVRLVSDEIYHGITYETEAATVRSYGQDAVVVNSFSKYYSMTGWWLGWMLVPPDLARSVECLAQNFYISPPALSQLAAIPAFSCRAELDAHVARYRVNRDLLITGLAKAGLSRFAPADGAFYLYADVSGLTRDSEEFCRRLLAETGIAITPRPRLRSDPRRQLGSAGICRLDRNHRRSCAAPD